MITRTDAELISEVRDRSDLGDSQFRSDAQIRRYLNECNRQLTSKLLAMHGADFLSTSDTISTVAGTALYDLPTDCFKAKYFRVTIGGTRMQIGRATTDEIDIDTDDAGWDIYGSVPKHRVIGNRVRFIPTPQAVHVVTVHYYHTSIAFDGVDDSAIEELADNADYLNSYWNFEEWVVIKAAIKIKHDQEEDTSQLYAELNELWQDISAIAYDRTDTEPEKIRDVYGLPEMEEEYGC